MNEGEEKNLAIEEFQKHLGVAFDKLELAKHLIELVPCYYDKARNWWLWDWIETRWERVDETEILNAIKRQANLNTINSKERIEMLEALKQVSRQNKPAEIGDAWIQFKNDIIDIRTGERFRAMPQWFVTNPIPWELNQDNFEETPVLDRIFEEWVGADYVKTLYEIIAYCMLPSYPIHRIFCFIGGGMNGKSCFLNLLRDFIGSNNVCSTELDNLLNSRFEASRLHKKLVCQMGETNFNEISKTSVLKKLSGGDLIGFEYKNKDPFEDRNYAKIIISTNNLPTTTDKTIGFYRRWMIIDFPNQFSEEKDILKDVPEEEMGCLALKCINILRELLRERKFNKEGGIEDRIQRYEDRSDPLQKFIEEFIKEEPNGNIGKTEFSKKFNSWCKENRFREISESTIGKKMKAKGYEYGREYVDWLYDGRGGQMYVWKGISWKISN